MEYSRALKSSFVSETTMKCNQQGFLDDIWCLTGINNVVVSSDDFSVDDLLDFSHKEDFNQLYVEESEEFEDKDLCLSVSSENRDDVFVSQHCFSNSDAGSGVFQPLPAGELPVPVDEMEDLEWLSQFVDDSAFGMSLLCPDDVNCKEKTRIIDINQCEPDVKIFTILGLPYPVPKKARRKRSKKPCEHMWSLDLLLFTESLSSSVSSSQDSSLTGSTSSFMPVIPIMDSFGETFQTQVTKKQKRNRGVELGSKSDSSQSLRWCSHCLVQKTPQWRTGPLGPKTLCNACGVRFKSGRLFPEYRPACSPTFAGDIHSNSHRKVLEMRRKKEAVEFVIAGSGVTRKFLKADSENMIYRKF